MRRLPLALLACLAAPAAPAAERLDDSASPQQRIAASARYRFEETSGVSVEQFHAFIAEARGVEVRLNTAKYVGRRAEIYLVLPLNARGLSHPSALQLEWQAQGRFAAPRGALAAGARALLFRGLIAQPQLIEVFDFVAYFDERLLVGAIEFAPHFEIELLP